MTDAIKEALDRFVDKILAYKPDKSKRKTRKKKSDPPVTEISKEK